MAEGNIPAEMFSEPHAQTEAPVHAPSSLESTSSVLVAPTSITPEASVSTRAELNATLDGWLNGGQEMAEAIPVKNPFTGIDSQGVILGRETIGGKDFVNVGFEDQKGVRFSVMINVGNVG